MHHSYCSKNRPRWFLPGIFYTRGDNTYSERLVSFSHLTNSNRRERHSINVHRAIAFQSDDKYDPQQFLPERFLDKRSNAVDPARWAFGFGRRWVFLVSVNDPSLTFLSSLCPGRDLAQSSVFIAATTIMKCFDLSAFENDQIVPEFDEHLVRYRYPLFPIFPPH